MNEPARNPETRIALFQRREIRRTIHKKEWWFELGISHLAASGLRSQVVTSSLPPRPSPYMC